MLTSRWDHSLNWHLKISKGNFRDHGKLFWHRTGVYTKYTASLPHAHPPARSRGAERRRPGGWSLCPSSRAWGPEAPSPPQAPGRLELSTRLQAGPQPRTAAWAAGRASPCQNELPQLGQDKGVQVTRLWAPEHTA